MASLYIYFDKRSARNDGRGQLKIALSHMRKTAYHSLGITISPKEWDAGKLLVTGRPDKRVLNAELHDIYANYCKCLHAISSKRDISDLLAREVMGLIEKEAAKKEGAPADSGLVLPVYTDYISMCRKKSTSQVYRSSLHNLTEYCGEDGIELLRFKDINVAWLRKYQSWLLDYRRMEVNGANVYLRNLRTIFNFAVKSELTDARYPFRDIDMSTAEPDKKSIPYEKFLEWATKPMDDGRAFYRDLFMLSFYLCGIRPVDLLNVRADQVEEGRLVYCPEKLNGRTRLSVKIEPEAWALIRKYKGQDYLINVMDSRADYRAFCKHWNTALKAIGEDVLGQKKGRNGQTYTTVKHKSIIPYISAYYARTCWATYAYNLLDISMDTISQALGHKSGLKVTNFYVKRDSTRADRANRALIDRVKADMQAYREGRYTPA